MKPEKKTAVAVGVLFIAATVSSLLCTALTSSVTQAPDYLTRASSHADQLIVGALLLVAAGVSVVTIPALLFPILRRHDEGIALCYLGIRILEAVTLIVDAVALLVLVTLSRAYPPGGPPSSLWASGALLQGAQHWAFLLNPVVFGVGALLFYSLLYRSRLVPRWLSGWGFVGGVLVFAFGLMGMFGGVSMLWAVPIGVQEMALAGWLIVKGFSPAATGSEARQLSARLPSHAMVMSTASARR